MKKSPRLKFFAWNDILWSNAYKAKSTLQFMVSYIDAIITIPRMMSNRETIAYNRTVVIIVETIWAVTIFILGIRPIAKAAGQRDLA